MDIREKLVKRGVWFRNDTMSSKQAVAFSQRLESMNYSALWLPESTGRDPFVHMALLASHTSELIFATGIANIYHRHPGMTKQSAATLAEMSNNRFLLGLGVSHAPIVEGIRHLNYSNPLKSMRQYLEAMQHSPYTSIPPSIEPPCVLAALGPKMLELAGEYTDGAHPYFTTPEHTAMAKEILGEGKMLCVEQKVAMTANRDVAHGVARSSYSRHASLPNYRNNWKRLGFTDEDIDQGTDRFLDAIVAWGTPDQINTRLAEHEEAGATHICIHPLNIGPEHEESLWETLEALAPSTETL